jgi:hypothetical protein
LSRASVSAHAADADDLPVCLLASTNVCAAPDSMSCFCHGSAAMPSAAKMLARSFSRGSAKVASSGNALPASPCQ